MEKEIIQLPCLECKSLVSVAADSLEAQGVFNVFCPDAEKNCEDKFALKQ